MKKYVTLVVAIGFCLFLLTGCGSAGGAQENADAMIEEEEDSEPAGPDDEYVVAVMDDQTEDPLSGAKVQVISDAETLDGTTDQDGVVIFKIADGHYTVKLVEAPGGYEGTDEVLEMTESEKSAVFRLKKN